VISYFLTSASHPSERLVHYRIGNVEAKGTSVGFEIPVEQRAAVRTDRPVQKSCGQRSLRHRAGLSRLMRNEIHLCGSQD